MSLVEAIDEAVAYVRAHSEWMARVEIEEFYRLAENVYVSAFRAGLSDAMPKVPEMQPQLESDLMSLPPVQFESKLNLPGDWDTTPPTNKDGLPTMHSLSGDLLAEPAERAFLVCASPRWFQDMETLRVLAEAKPEAKSGALAGEGGESLTDDEYTVLRALRDARPRRVYVADLSASAMLARKTCGQIAASLAERGLVDYSGTKRNGAAITPAGVSLLATERPPLNAP